MRIISYSTSKPITTETDTYTVIYDLPSKIATEPIVIHSRGFDSWKKGEIITFSEFDANRSYELVCEFDLTRRHDDCYGIALKLAGYKPKFQFRRNNLNDSPMSLNNPSADWENKIVDEVVNSNEELKIHAAAVQLMLYDRVKAALEEPYFTDIGRRLEDIDWHLPKYSYIKNVEHNGRKYLLTINYKTLRVSFNMQEE